ncbi:MAG: hypothetical protein II857_04190 [Selenomonadaceae bacterium]|nr:hypothetical protein [Selenomonadaceae bacterium]
MKKFFVPLILAVIFLSGCGQEDSPEAALNEIKIALAERDSAKLSERVDLDKFFATTYDATTIELAKNYDEYGAKYPDDPYFQHSADFLTTYNAEHKDLHLKFLDGVKNSFFAKVPEPATPEENPTAYVANEFEKIRAATNATIKETRIEDDRATIILELAGDSSLRGQFIGQMTFELAFHRDEKNRWHFDRIENLDELMPPLVDKAELVWINFNQPL